MGSFEYRKLLRANILLKVLYKTKKWPLIEGIAYTKNLGVTGINIVMVDKLDKNTELELQMYLPEEPHPIYARGKMAWQYKCSYVPESKQQYYSSGIQFTDMTPDDAIRTSDFVRNLLIGRSEAEIKKIIDIIENIKHPKLPAKNG